jgi:2-oxoisovalerate dehydrogenase E1 component
VGEGIITAITEAGHGANQLQRIVGADTFTPLAGAAFLVIPSDEQIIAAADTLASA